MEEKQYWFKRLQRFRAGVVAPPRERRYAKSGDLRLHRDIEGCNVEERLLET